MCWRKVKVYTDGSHYIGIPRLPGPKRHKASRSINHEEVKRKKVFEEKYKENTGKKTSERKDIVLEQIKPLFENVEDATKYVDNNLQRKQRNLIIRRIRLWRKVNLQEWEFFATFTYDGNKHDEKTFRVSLLNCLKHLSNRKGWKYIGVWERSSEKKRLHFHALLYVPKGKMVGKNIEVNDYSFQNRKRQVTYQNTFFNEKFGRTDMREISKADIGNTVGYLVKYMEKTGEKIVYSKGLPQYFVTDIIEDDVICPYGIDNRKIILSDNFNCMLDEEYFGQVSPEVISKLPKCN